MEDLSNEKAIQVQYELHNAGATTGLQSTHKPTTLPPTTPPTPTHTTFNVHLEAFGRKKIAVIKAVRHLLNLGLKDTKTLVESAPVLLKKNLSQEEAQDYKDQLEQTGATIRIQGN